MRLASPFAFFLLNQSVAFGFLLHVQNPAFSDQRQSHVQPLFSVEDMPQLGEEYGGLSFDASIFESLKQRQNELDLGIGKRYICRTRQGFLNVHKEPSEPFNPYNIVGQLTEGDIVTSIGPPRGGWIRHEQGWSIAVYNGFKWLEELKE